MPCWIKWFQMAICKIDLQQSDKNKLTAMYSTSSIHCLTNMPKYFPQLLLKMLLFFSRSWPLKLDITGFGSIYLLSDLSVSLFFPLPQLPIVFPVLFFLLDSSPFLDVHSPDFVALHTTNALFFPSSLLISPLILAMPSLTLKRECLPFSFLDHIGIPCCSIPLSHLVSPFVSLPLLSFCCQFVLNFFVTFEYSPFQFLQSLLLIWSAWDKEPLSLLLH